MRNTTRHSSSASHGYTDTSEVTLPQDAGHQFANKSESLSSCVGRSLFLSAS